MGRKAIAIDKDLLGRIVAECESRKSFGSRSALWAEVAADIRSKAIGLSPQVAMMKAKLWGVTINTPIGERGRRPGTGLPAEAIANRQGGKNKRRTIPLEMVAELKKIYPSSVHTKVDRAAKGSYKAIVELNCMACTNQQKKEITLCTIKNCIAWSARPYQNRKVEKDIHE